MQKQREYEELGGRMDLTEFEELYNSRYKEFCSLYIHRFYEELKESVLSYTADLFGDTHVRDIELQYVTRKYSIPNEEIEDSIADGIDTILTYNNLVADTGETHYVGEDIRNFIRDLSNHDDYMDVQLMWQQTLNSIVSDRRDLYDYTEDYIDGKGNRITKDKLTKIWVGYIKNGIGNDGTAGVDEIIDAEYDGKDQFLKQLEKEYTQDPSMYALRMKRMAYGVHQRKAYYTSNPPTNPQQRAMLGQLKLEQVSNGEISYLLMQVKGKEHVYTYYLTPYSIYSDTHKQFVLKYSAGVTLADYTNALVQLLGKTELCREVIRVARLRKLNEKLQW